MANLLQFIYFHRIGRRFSSDIKKYFGFLSIDSWLKQIQFWKYFALFFYKNQIWFWLMSNKKNISYFGVHAPSPEIQYQEVILLPGMTFWNHKLPLRAANKAITNGPDATIKARTVSCAITSKFILVQPLSFRFSLIKSTIE